MDRLVPARAPAASPLRRARVRRAFDSQVVREAGRMTGPADRTLRGLLIERFLARAVGRSVGRILEVGPGPGRFTPTLAADGREVVLLDLSRPMLRAARRRLAARGRGGFARPAFVQGAAEGFSTFADAAFGAVILVGLFGFFARDSRTVLSGAARVLAPGGVLVVETQSATGAASELFPRSPEGARAILRSPERYYMRRVFYEGYQPFDPRHLAHWEYRFWRPSEIERALGRHGFRTEERMSIAPMLGAQPRLLSFLRRDPRAWRSVLEYEEEAGRRPECFGIGFGFLVSARRRGATGPGPNGARRARSPAATER